MTLSKINEISVEEFGVVLTDLDATAACWLAETIFDTTGIDAFPVLSEARQKVGKFTFSPSYRMRSAWEPDRISLTQSFGAESVRLECFPSSNVSALSCPVFFRWDGMFGSTTLCVKNPAETWSEFFARLEDSHASVTKIMRDLVAELLRGAMDNDRQEFLSRWESNENNPKRKK